MPRDLNDPDGCRFSSLRWIWQPACLERVGEWMSGVWRQGVGRSGSGCDIFGRTGSVRCVEISFSVRRFHALMDLYLWYLVV